MTIILSEVVVALVVMMVVVGKSYSWKGEE